MTRRAVKDKTYTTKGDMFVATGDDDATRVAIGSDGQFFTADSSAPTGVAWSALTSALDWQENVLNEAVINTLLLLGDARIFVPLNEESGTTLYDKSYRSHDLTASVDVSGYSGYDGRLLSYLTLDGATEYASVADHADFSFNGGGDVAFSFAAMIRTAGATTGTLLSKWDVTTGLEAREWNIDLVAGAPRISIYDETNNDGFDTVCDAAISDNVWHLIVMTYGGTAAVTGLTPYVDGLEVSHADTAAAGTYANMVDTTTGVYLGAHVDAAAATNLYAGDIAWVALAQKEMSAHEVWTLWNEMSYIANL